MNHFVKKLFIYSLGGIILILAALINGFPVVYSDTSTYLSSGFEFETPFDRPIMYGLFLWLTSLGGTTLWTVIWTQGVLVTMLIDQLIRRMFNTPDRPLWLVPLVTLVLALFTSVSWSVSQLIADIFTAISAMSMALLLTVSFSFRKHGALLFLFLISTCTHLSHVSFNVVVIVIAIAIRLWKKEQMAKIIYLRSAFWLLGITFLSISTMGAALSKSKHVFMMGALVEHGIAQEYLDEYCGERQFEMCKYRDRLPDRAWVFIWEEESPFQDMGAWKGTKEEFNEIIKGTLTEPKYIGLHIRESLKATWEQLLTFSVGDGNGAFKEETLLYQRVEKFVGHELDSYKGALQYQEKLGFLTVYDLIQKVIVIISLLLLPYLVFVKKVLFPEMYGPMGIIFLTILVNAWSCGTFANAINRLGTKMIWMLPLLVIFSALQLLIREGKLNKEHKS